MLKGRYDITTRLCRRLDHIFPFLIKIMLNIKLFIMKLIKPSFQILNPLTTLEGLKILKNIEAAGRTCYKSENKITNTSSKEFIQKLLNHNPPHESVIEHEKISVRIICDRGISHELVRHRIASFSQESTRYCNYSTNKHNNQLTFIIPEWLNLEEREYHNSDIAVNIFNNIETWRWVVGMHQAESNYLSLIKSSWSPQQARSVLPNSLKTEIVITANLREWRLIFKQRTAKAAHPQMREIMIPLYKELNNKIPIIFETL